MAGFAQTEGAIVSDPFKFVIDALAAARRPRREGPSPRFIALILIVAAACAALGIWQLRAAGMVQAANRQIAERLAAPARPLPENAEWVGLDPVVWNARRVRLVGTFVSGHTVLVHIKLARPKGRYSGPGFWVMTPFQLAGGGVVFVNRGFVPEVQKSVFGPAAPVPQGEVRLDGIARAADPVRAFTPGPDFAGHIDWVRDPERLVAISGLRLRPIADIYVDNQKGIAGGLPQAGETRLMRDDVHSLYADGLFALAALILVGLGLWIRRTTSPGSFTAGE